MPPVQVCRGNVCPRIQESPRTHRPSLSTTRGDGPRQCDTVLHRKQGEPSQNSGDATTPACEPPGEDGPPQPSLDHKVRFVTGKGLGLLFHPGPLDKWIGRDVTYEEATDRFWETPGEYLSDEMAES